MGSVELLNISHCECSQSNQGSVRLSEESIRWFDVGEQPSFCSVHLSSNKEYLLSQTQEKHPSRPFFTSQRERDVREYIQSDAAKLNLD